MARDAERTKRLLREAAVAEFALYGLDGTTAERIAARAGVNKERLYSYFGGKAALFATVLVEELDKVAAAVPIVVTCAEDLAQFAGETFDYLSEHPDLRRLVLWEGLADTGAVQDEANRRLHYDAKAQAITEAQRQGLIDDTFSAPHLLMLLLSLASWWYAAPQVARMLTNGPADESEATARRNAVVEAARRLATPRR
ncbi:TetR family transcriptional regulator [Streptomyces chartreusis]|uniref:TetR/AcrR family transcriptional regulator n=1 Tax=Streptomyces chartreusis TaxID=1969 RepID=UPI0036A1DEC7